MVGKCENSEGKKNTIKAKSIVSSLLISKRKSYFWKSNLVIVLFSCFAFYMGIC